MPSTTSVKFDVSDCTLREQSEEHLGWAAENGVYLVLRVPKQRTNWSFDLQDVAAARNYFSQQSATTGGVQLEMESIKVGSHAALRGLFKYRSPIPQSLGMMFVNILWIPFDDRTVQLNIESFEHGQTGGREAAVCVIEGEGQANPASSDPVKISSVEEMFSHMRGQPLRVLPSDASKYDQSFPDHPLSKVRRRMVQTIGTISVSGESSASIQQEAAKWWKFW